MRDEGFEKCIYTPQDHAISPPHRNSSSSAITTQQATNHFRDLPGSSFSIIQKHPRVSQSTKMLAKTIIACTLATLGSTAAILPRTGGGDKPTPESCTTRDDGNTSPKYCPNLGGLGIVIPVQLCSISTVSRITHEDAILTQS